MAGTQATAAIDSGQRHDGGAPLRVALGTPAAMFRTLADQCAHPPMRETIRR